MLEHRTAESGLNALRRREILEVHSVKDTPVALHFPIEAIYVVTKVKSSEVS